MKELREALDALQMECMRRDGTLSSLGKARAAFVERLRASLRAEDLDAFDKAFGLEKR